MITNNTYRTNWGGGQHDLDSSPISSKSTLQTNPALDSTPRTKFTTNRDTNTLLNRFKDIFQDKNIAHLAFLIGFFRISGFVHLHNLIQDYARFGSIRILVGLNVDELLYTLQAQGLDKAYQDKRFRELFTRTQRQFIQEEQEYSQEIEDSIHTLRDALESKKIEIRIVREKNVHAKFYIFHSAPMSSHTGGTRYSGSLIVGSSNLSENGLERNYEFNLESNASDDIFYALQEFEYLWGNAVELSPNDIESATKHTYLEIRTPKELYYKLLLCHFGESFLTIDSSIKDLFKDYKPYDYQIQAIQEGLDKIKRYNGFFLSDVVGLGKTLIASIIAKKLQLDSVIKGKILIVCPPALLHSWKKHFDDLRIAGYERITHDSLHKIQDTKDDYELIIIDESHRFRTFNSNRYELLSKITQGKKVILLSATPQNNSPQDIANQVYLFCPRRKPHIEGIGNLEKFFAPLAEEFNRIKKERKELESTRLSLDTSSFTQKCQELDNRLKNNSQTLRTKLLEHIMIRRTRADIQELYKADMEAQGLTFPEISTPQDLTYDLDSHTHNLATQTILLLANDEKNTSTLGTFNYHRYKIYPNLTTEGKDTYMASYGADEQRSDFYTDTANRLSVLMQKILFKRFDSSITAFKATLKMQIRSHNALITSFEHNDIIIPKNYSNREKLYEAIESDDEDALENFLKGKEDKVIHLQSHHFKPDFLERLKADKATLEHLLSKWEDIEGDPKIDVLLAFLDSHTEHKIVLFTEAKTTAHYIDEQLEARGFDRHICVDSATRDKLEVEIRANFDANYPKEKQKDAYQLIISTDTLAEGVNLHRADIIINYDTPYNSTKLMQRIGRINRIGTSFESIYIYNFKPTHLADTIINIINISLQKLQSFHYTLGEDSAIYDEREEVQSQKIFSQLKQQDDEQSPDTKYKKDLKELYVRNKDFFERIKAMPLKSRTIITGTHTQSYAYIKQSDTTKSDKDAHSPYHITPSSTLLSEPEARECEFYDIAEFLRTHLNAKPYTKSNSALSAHYAHINVALQAHTQSIKATNSEPLSEPSLSKQDSQALTKIQHLPQELISKEQKTLLIDSLKRGNPKLTKRINKTSFSSAQDISALITESSLQPTEPSPKEQLDSLTPPQIQLSITTIAKQPTTKEIK